MPPTPTTNGIHRFDLPPDEMSALRVRRELESLDYDFDEATVELLKLAATELVTNAVLHSGARDAMDPVVVYVRVGPPTLLLKVCDRGPGIEARPRRADPLDEGGRGLMVVDAIAHSWGSSQVEVDGSVWSCVWACFGDQALPACGPESVVRPQDLASAG